MRCLICTGNAASCNQCPGQAERESHPQACASSRNKKRKVRVPDCSSTHPRSVQVLFLHIHVLLSKSPFFGLTCFLFSADACHRHAHSAQPGSSSTHLHARTHALTRTRARTFRVIRKSSTGRSSKSWPRPVKAAGAVVADVMSCQASAGGMRPVSSRAPASSTCNRSVIQIKGTSGQHRGQLR